MRAISILSLLFLLPFYSSCSGGDGSKTDSGQDTSSDTDTDTETDTETDTDTGSDTDTDIDTDTIIVSDAGPWDWEDLPEGEDCGAGCKQLTFTKNVRWEEWDVWGDLIVFQDETLNTCVVDHKKNKKFLMPNFYPEYGIGPSMGSANMYPATIYEKTICYSKSVWGIMLSDIICADLETEAQTLVYHRTEQGGEFPNPAKFSDLYNNRFVSMGGCGDVLDSWPLCYFDIDSPGVYEEIQAHLYGSHNSIWEDIVVWYSEAEGVFDIKGYDFSTKTTFNIASDDEDQFMARIHGNHVVYQDLRFGENSDPTMGDWNHSVVFMYDLETKERKQITNQDWISAYPDVYGEIVVWADYRDSANPNDKNSLAGVQIWGYNLSTETEFQITNIPNRAKSLPRIWEDKVFVAMYKETPGEDAIYMFDLPEGAK
jgi:hypothetical protein